MLRRAFLFTVVLAASTGWLRAADVDGTWRGAVDTPNGPMELTFVFEAEGESLSGTVGSEMGQLPIENGKLNGEVLTFDVNVNGSIITHEARHSGDEITIKATGDWGTTEYVVTRVKAE